jgi:hypothetical protein
VVHLRGVVVCTGADSVAFALPPGYRPRNGKAQLFNSTSGGADGDDTTIIAGVGVDPSIPDGAVLINSANAAQVLDGISFRAEG